jgi:hypothetical protein
VKRAYGVDECYKFFTWLPAEDALNGQHYGPRPFLRAEYAASASGTLLKFTTIFFLFFGFYGWSAMCSFGFQG